MPDLDIRTMTPVTLGLRVDAWGSWPALFSAIAAAGFELARSIPPKALVGEVRAVLSDGADDAYVTVEYAVDPRPEKHVTTRVLGQRFVVDVGMSPVATSGTA